MCIYRKVALLSFFIFLTLTLQTTVFAGPKVSSIPIVGFKNGSSSSRTGSNGYTIFGTGFVLQWKRRVVTTADIIESIPARHLIPRSRVGVLVPASKDEGYEGGSYQFHSVVCKHIDRRLNVAFLEVDSDLPLQPLKPSLEKLALEKEVLMTGFHHARLLPVTHRRMIGMRTPTNGPFGLNNLYSVDSPVYTGVNGGAVLLPKTGEVCGIALVHTRLLTRTIRTIPSVEPTTWGLSVIMPIGPVLEALRSLKLE